MGESNFDTVVAATAFTGNITGEISYTPVARTATTTGATTGTIADAGMLQLVTVTATAATQIIILPTPTPGTIVMLKGPASTGFELRTNAPSTVAINGGSGSNAESAIAADAVAFLFCSSATSWDGWEINAGTTFAAVEQAA